MQAEPGMGSVPPGGDSFFNLTKLMPTSDKKTDFITSVVLSVSPPFFLRHWKWWRLAILLTLDVVILASTYWVSYLLRFDWAVESLYVGLFRGSLPIVLAVNLSIFFLFGLYRDLWKHANFGTAVSIAKATCLGSLLSWLICYAFTPMPPPRSIAVIHWMLSSIVIAASRFSWRSWNSFKISLTNRAQERCFIYGAGSGGDLLARHILTNEKFPYRVVGFIDDDRNKLGRRIHGFIVLGTGRDLERLCQKHDASTVILAMPSAGGKQIREAVTLCHRAKARPWVMPDLTDSLGREVFQPRAVDTRDLLRRSPKSIDFDHIRELYSGQVVVITGAGGSIGSEICRQVLRCGPKKLVLIDSSEFNLYRIDNEIAESPDAGGVERVSVLGSTTSREHMRSIFEKHRPAIVLHAAANKHVPIVEANVCEGIRNNVLGTLVVLEEALRIGARRFVLISTDKAVRPSSVMGATKRVCELLLQAFHCSNDRDLSLCAVRFGNVLGSSGSVIPRFTEQIQRGGPVTVTHPDMTRYFMLTSEAVGLVLQASALAKGGETFVLNMGEPVRIYEMAEQLIRLAGKEPGRDIEIEVTGMRPGEKLFEELLLDGTEQHTLHDDLFIATSKPIDPEKTRRQVLELIALAQQENEDLARKFLKTLLASEQPLENDPCERLSPSRDAEVAL